MASEARKNALVFIRILLYDLSAFKRRMDVLLLSDLPGIGKKNDLIVVTSGYAMNYLLPQRKAIVVTPNVRKQYGEQIKQRAMERESERQLHLSLANTLSGKVIHIAAKAAKSGKLYAAVTEATVEIGRAHV